MLLGEDRTLSRGKSQDKMRELIYLKNWENQESYFPRRKKKDNKWQRNALKMTQELKRQSQE